MTCCGAVKDCIQEIGEAAARVTDAGRDRAPRVPWTKIVGMRHILVHVYYDLDNDAIWRVVREHLPSLVEEFERELRRWASVDGR
ncbi:MAG TPA: DUF86 domain-containing protein [Phycisphaerales bacterium]|nr:DUF86 domain-containing protein [Phycisphaerales bacterium]